MGGEKGGPGSGARVQVTRVKESSCDKESSCVNSQGGTLRGALGPQDIQVINALSPGRPWQGWVNEPPTPACLSGVLAGEGLVLRGAILGWEGGTQTCRVKVKSMRRVEECQGNISALGNPGLGALTSCLQTLPEGLRAVMAWCEVPVSGQHKGHPRPARARDEDLEGGHRQRHRSCNLLSARGDSAGCMGTGSRDTGDMIYGAGPQRLARRF